MKVLKKTVLAGGVIYPAGTPATPELEERISGRQWTGGDDTPPPLTQATAPAVTPEPEPDPRPDAQEPPRAGRGSGLDAWKAYAESLTLNVPEDATRDEVIALVDAARADV